MTEVVIVDKKMETVQRAALHSTCKYTVHMKSGAISWNTVELEARAKLQKGQLSQNKKLPKIAFQKPKMGIIWNCPLTSFNICSGNDGHLR